MSNNPTSHFITLPNRPIVQENGEIAQGLLKLHYWEWQGHQPTILICHGASFHGRCYDRIINEALSGFHVISLDFRGHGRSQKHPPPYKLRWFGEDVFQFIEILDLPKNNLLGIGHSLGGHSLILAASLAPRQLFQSLLLIDPAIYSLMMYEIGDQILNNNEVILRRKHQWLSIEDMVSTIGKLELYSRWPKDVLHDYCTYALDENFKLACTSEYESSIYRTVIKSESNIYEIIQNSKFINYIPIHIVRTSLDLAADKFEAPPTAPDLVKWFKKGRDTQLIDIKHLFPMEQPHIAIDLVKEFIQEYKTIRSHL
jgi:pimeloyl-ACP methyl ester carboxylesterase